jgi:hypothetical protein
LLENGTIQIESRARGRYFRADAFGPSVLREVPRRQARQQERSG